MDDDFYRLHADYEERNWWFVAKNRIVLSLLERIHTARRFTRRSKASGGFSILYLRSLLGVNTNLHPIMVLCLRASHPPDSMP